MLFFNLREPESRVRTAKQITLHLSNSNSLNTKQSSIIERRE